MNLKYITKSEDNGKNIKYILKKRLNISERLIKRLKMNGRIFCNSSSVFVNAIVGTSDVVEVNMDFEEDCENINPEKIQLDILYEDESLIVLNKPPFMVVHPTFNHQSGTIANGLVNYFNEIGIKRKIRPVSRLDRDTSGIIIFAKNEFSQESLIQQMQDKTFIKEYFGVVHGLVKKKCGTIDLPIERKPESIMLRHVAESGSPAVTHYEIMKYLNNATLLKFHLETGRTHQIRVHCQAINHPLIGDTLYPYLTETSEDFISSKNNNLISRQALHSYRVCFIHPITKEPLELTSPIPSDISELLSALEIAGK